MYRWLTVIIGVLIGWASTMPATADHVPPLDRPSPPPCCADGLCYPNPQTWGWYATRWRRWPTAQLEPAIPGVTPPAPLDPDIRPYEIPPPEEEERRAPPPSTPRVEEAEVGTIPATPGGAAPAPMPGAPAQPTQETPQTTPFAPPTKPIVRPPAASPFGEPQNGPEPRLPQTPFDAEPPPTVPFSDPGGMPPTTLPFGEPTGDLDPPPALPFGTAARNTGVETHPVDGPASKSQPRRGPAAPPSKPVSDPPPSLPVALASWTK